VYRGQDEGVQLLQPTVVREYLEGERLGAAGRRERVPLADITLLEVRGRSLGGTMVALGSLTSVLFLLAVGAGYYGW
jgi:hypothetical protein